MKKRIESIKVEILPDYDPDPSYLEQDGFEKRLNEYQSGAFGFIGIQAVAEVVIGMTCQTLRSGGLWGIEDDSDESYLREVEQEEIGALTDILKECGFSEQEIIDSFANA